MLGKWLYMSMNFSPKVLLKTAFYCKEKLTKEIHSQYLMPFKKKQNRYSTWVLARELYGSNAFYESIWQKRANIQDIPTLLLWGIHDKFISTDNLEKFIPVFNKVITKKLDAGHFIQEEQDDLWKEVDQFIGTYPE